MSATTTGGDEPRIAVAGEPSVERDRAAASLRRLSHAIVGHDADAALLNRIAELADRTSEQVEQGRPRQRPISTMKQHLWEQHFDDGARMSHFPDCVVSGPANPMGIAIQVTRSGDEAVARLRLGPAFEGAPERAHGGVVAAVFDDVMGYVLLLIPQAAYTGQLVVNYRAPVPVGVDLDVRAWLDAREGRKLHLRAQMSHDGDVLCDATGLFIAVRSEAD